MIIVMEPNATREQIQTVDSKLQSLGFQTILNEGDVLTVIAAIGDKSVIKPKSLEAMPGVKEIVPIQDPYKRASRAKHRQDTAKQHLQLQHLVLQITPACYGKHYARWKSSHDYQWPIQSG